jgi:hypothetical protein
MPFEAIGRLFDDICHYRSETDTGHTTQRNLGFC